MIFQLLATWKLFSSHLQLQNFHLFCFDEFLLLLFTTDGGFGLLALQFLLFLLDPLDPEMEQGSQTHG